MSDPWVIGPRNPAYRVSPRQLEEATGHLHLLHMNEGLVHEPDGRKAALAQIVARRAD